MAAHNSRNFETPMLLWAFVPATTDNIAHAECIMDSPVVPDVTPLFLSVSPQLFSPFLALSGLSRRSILPFFVSVQMARLASGLLASDSSA